MSGVQCVLAGSGEAAFSGLGSDTVTVGYYSDSTTYVWGFVYPTIGSMATGVWSNRSYQIAQLGWQYINYSGVYYVVMGINGDAPNSGWTTLTIDGNAYSRASASYVQSGSTTYWFWNYPPSNPFGTTVGVTKAVVWS